MIERLAADSGVATKGVLLCTVGTFTRSLGARSGLSEAIYVCISGQESE